MMHISSKITTNYNEYSKINEFLVSWKESKPHVFPHFPFPLGPTVKREKEKNPYFVDFVKVSAKMKSSSLRLFSKTVILSVSFEKFVNVSIFVFIEKELKMIDFVLHFSMSVIFTIRFGLFLKLFLKFDYKFRFYVESKGTHFFKTSFWSVKRFWDIVFVVL